ncbi:MAG: 50S ribosomal protein L30e [Desulfurococcales archaeon]|nr:50S ribosomal protein L30e [Desulfurococcales archaeon]MEB3759175.1 50S ribosomal protein L30e [Desulfurococcales archaeon]MEB3772861.1 50S ribosomal protein L30e [Desulfurococcales archaeon]MEB3786616.1 50S ribosomal protein L30e [Desulfurococcales archaeon]MEB3798847.1 50S ribosomal protein L30e [Desulfurococcales archaeon]
MASFERELKGLLKTGKVTIGSKESIKAVKTGKAKMVIVAMNALPRYRESVKYYAKLGGIPVYEYKGTSVELGALSGKPYPVSMIAVLDEGSSRILEVVEEG